MNSFVNFFLHPHSWKYDRAYWRKLLESSRSKRQKDWSQTTVAISFEYKTAQQCKQWTMNVFGLTTVLGCFPAFHSMLRQQTAASREDEEEIVGHLHRAGIAAVSKVRTTQTQTHTANTSGSAAVAPQMTNIFPLPGCAWISLAAASTFAFFCATRRKISNHFKPIVTYTIHKPIHKPVVKQ